MSVELLFDDIFAAFPNNSIMIMESIEPDLSQRLDIVVDGKKAKVQIKREVIDNLRDLHDADAVKEISRVVIETIKENLPKS